MLPETDALILLRMAKSREVTGKRKAGTVFGCYFTAGFLGQICSIWAATPHCYLQSRRC